MFVNLNMEEILSGKSEEWTLIELPEDEEERDAAIEDILITLLFR